MTRRSPNLSEKLAATLLFLKTGNDWLIPEPVRSEGSAKQILALVQFDHDPIPHANGGGTEPQNLTPRRVAQHQDKTCRIDTPRIAKGKRLSEADRAHCAALAAKVGMIAEAEVERRKTRTIPSGPLPCGKKSGWKKPMNGKAVRRVK